MKKEEAIEQFDLAIKNYENTLRLDCVDEQSKGVIRQAIELYSTALSALRPVSREQVKKAEWIWSTGDVYICSSCGEKTHVDECMGTPIYNFCPFCMAPMTDEAVQMVVERLEALYEQ